MKWEHVKPEAKTLGGWVDNLIYERNRSIGQVIDDILYEPGPIARWVAFGAGGAASLYVVHAVFRKIGH